MHMHACMLRYRHVNVCVCARVCMYVCICIHTYIQNYLSTYFVQVHMQERICTGQAHHHYQYLISSVANKFVKVNITIGVIDLWVCDSRILGSSSGLHFLQHVLKTNGLKRILPIPK